MHVLMMRPPGDLYREARPHVLYQKTRQTDVPCEDLSGISASRWGRARNQFEGKNDELSGGPLHHSVGVWYGAVRGAAPELHGRNCGVLRAAYASSKWQPSSGRPNRERNKSFMCKVARSHGLGTGCFQHFL